MAIYQDLNGFFPTERSLLVEQEAVYQSLFNLFNTRKGERPFLPEFGFDLEDELFELMDASAEFAVLDLINREVNRWERRVNLRLADSTVTAYPDENKYEIDLKFGLQGISDQIFQFRGSFIQ